jgi:hypothetical protein
MSTQYPGGIISKTAPVPSGPYADSTAPGIWTLEQQAALAKQGNWPTAGNVNPSAFIENLFSTYVYSGTGATQTITNGINLSGKGGLVWTKIRSSADSHILADTVRGVQKDLNSNSTAGQQANLFTIQSFLSNGYTVAQDSGTGASGQTYVSWTFQEQAKFFDIVTYTGNGAASRSISHALGSKPGFVVIKRTDSTGNWFVAAWVGTTFWVGLDSSPFALNSSNGYNTPNGAAATSTTFDPNEVTISSSYGVTPSNANINGATYVAYLWATNAGGFGTSGSDNVISCGSVSYTNVQTDVNLGYEPQWIMWKKASGSGSWWMFDTIRGLVVDGGSGTEDRALYAELTNAESGTYGIDPTATGFQLSAGWGTGDYIYIAIRRGPMAVPTVGTTVFSPQVQTITGGANNVMASNSNFPIDWLPTRQSGVVSDWYQTSRLTNNYMSPNTTAAEAAYTYGFDKMSGVGGGTYGWNPYTTVSYAFKRAPNFFDVVCYRGTGSNTNFSHNLGVVPEMIITKRRSNTGPWVVYTATTGNTDYLQLYTNDAVQTNTGYYNSTTPTASVFTLGTSTSTNANANNFIAYLFATCPGVSKVGSYTGTGALQTVNCGFTSGARFVLIKRTDSTGDWWLYNSASGISSGNDPYLLVNSTAVEVTGTNYVDTDTTGFKVTAAAPAGLNANGGTYIFLAIA